MLECKKLDKLNKVFFSAAILFIFIRKYIIYFLNKQLDIGNTLSYLLLIPIGILILQILINNKYTVKSIIFAGIAGVLYLFTREGSILLLVLMAIAITEINDEFVVKAYLIMHILLLIICMISTGAFYDLGQHQQIHYRVVDGIRVARGTLGAGNPNFIFIIFLPIYASYIYLRFEKYNLIDRILILISMFVIYINTYSRTGLLAIGVGLMLVEIIRVVKIKNENIFGFMIRILPIILTLLSIATATLLNNSTLANKVLSSRPKHWNVYIVQFGKIFNKFGNDYPAYIRKLHPVDNSYIYILSILGMIALILLLVVLYNGLKEYIELDRKKDIVIVVIFLIYSFGENVLIDVALNFTLILLLKTLICSNSKTIDIYKYPKKILKK